jgi:hypothetical protein
MKNNLKSLSEELIKDIKSLDGVNLQFKEEGLVHELAEKLEAILPDEKEERVKAMRNMFALGQIFPSTN